jgi:hypothetical protein
MAGGARHSERAAFGGSQPARFRDAPYLLATACQLIFEGLQDAIKAFINSFGHQAIETSGNFSRSNAAVLPLVNKGLGSTG